MSIEPGTLLMAAGMSVGAIVWLVRLEGRINVTDARLEESNNATETRQKDIISRLERIERKQDANGK